MVYEFWTFASETWKLTKLKKYVHLMVFWIDDGKIL